MRCTYQPVGKYLLIERVDSHDHSVDCGKILAMGLDVFVGATGGNLVGVGQVVACVKVIATIGKDQYLVHSDDIVAVVTEMA